MCACMPSHFSCFQLFMTLWIVAHQPPLSMVFSRQEYWSGLPCHPPGDLPNPSIELHISCVSCTACGFFTAESLGKPLENVHPFQKVFFIPSFLFHSGQCKLFILDALAYLHKGLSYEGLDVVLKLMKAAPCSQD